jgi:pyruvate decarboxylase
VQAFADLLLHNLNPIMLVWLLSNFMLLNAANVRFSFVLNNDGYAVERLIHGLHAQYNKVPIWDYGGLAKVFGPAFPSKYHGPVKTCEQLASLLADLNFGKGDVFEVRSQHKLCL